ncbi:ABC transporter ATP-binding protein [Desulfoplanes formicivorans]|uniref:Branched-chain amino acid ABC transporter ATP-binding protein n=1 Tax=Desulfoplanes formicivorans TaxID=1592317 RepID=A0A194AG91_9BACT|nr:ABC transporter ATP-binding protein [Desulfoplanes formicivorans]GAU08225.1 branched-chain amino acid ABC transporter ATP-binding protein [Desulfoplanes formicivorans]
MTTPASPVLQLKKITKRFGSLVANDHITLDIHAGTIHALLGENGAGKSTLMSVLSGRYQPDEGEIVLNNETVRFTSPSQALARGIGMVYQRFMLIEPMSVVENIVLGTTSDSPFLDLKGAAIRIRQLSEQYGLAVDPNARIADLSMGERQRVEILKLLFRNAEILIFDEPTAILTPPEITAFFKTLKKLAERGHPIVFITHKLDEVMELADRISIMRRGKMITHILPQQIRSKRELARLMVGREIVLKVDKKDITPGEPVLEVKGLKGINEEGRTVFEEINLEVKKGEILAITGVAGNGQEALIAGLAGLAPLQQGSIFWQGKTYTPQTWVGANKQDLAYVPEDRHTTGTIGAMDLAENYMLTRINEFSQGPFLQSAAARSMTAKAITTYNIRTPRGIDSKAGQLSGGNLQKIILARELEKNPRLIIAEQPTQGLDIGATEEVWQTLIAQREHAGILLVSGDLKEVLSLADRIAVMFRGKILEIIPATDTDGIARIGLLMAGTSDHN